MSPTAGALLRRILGRAVRVEIFHLAGAVAFSVILAAIPFTFLLVALAGFLLTLINEPAEAVVLFLLGTLPATGTGIDPMVFAERAIDGVIEGRAGVSFIGTILFVWFAARLIGSLRTVLRIVFDVDTGKGIVVGKLFDAGVVILGALLITLNFAVTLFLTTWGGTGMERIGIDGEALGFLQMMLVRGIGFVAIWALCLLVYRYLADLKISWRTASVAATFMAVSHEVLKLAFSWYITSVASYGSIYGNLANLAVMLFWIYYTSCAFVLAAIFAREFERGRFVPSPKADLAVPRRLTR